MWVVLKVTTGILTVRSLTINPYWHMLMKQRNSYLFPQLQPS